MLWVENLNQFYGQSHTLWDFSLEVPEAACTCVMGRNGVGKTTLLKCVMGDEPIHSGRMLLQTGAGEPVDLANCLPEDRARLGIGYVPQGRQIFPLLTVEENLRTGLGAVAGRKIPDRVFELFPVLDEMRDRRGGDLSGGQQQQLAIGRALVLQPRLLLLDEPGEGIQPNIVAQIGQVIRRLIEEDGLTVLLVEQKLPFARRFADRFAIVDRGRPVAQGGIEGLSDELIHQHLTV